MATEDNRTTSEIYQEAAEVNDQVTKGLRNALQIVDDTRDVQATTLEELKRQGDQLVDVQANLDDVQEDNKYAQAVLDDIGCLCCCFCNNKSKNLTRPSHQANRKPDSKTKPTTKPDAEHIMIRKPTEVVGKGRQQKKAANDTPLERIEAGKEEQDNIIDQISDGLDILAQGAKAMADEIAIQNPIIDGIAKQTDDVTRETKQTTHHSAFRRHLRN